MTGLTRSRRPELLAGLVFLVGLLLAGASGVWQKERRQSLAMERFALQAQQVVDRLEARMRTYEYGLRGARGAVQAAGEYGVTRASFNIYHESRDVDVEFPGAHGFGFIRRVPVAARLSFLELARQDGMPDFGIHQLAPHDGEMYVIQYIEPVERNLTAVGLDIASEKSRYQAAYRALRTGKATITEPITLVQATGQPERAFLLLLPIYRVRMPITTDDEREAAGYGWSYAPLVIDEVLARFERVGDIFSIAIADQQGERGEFYRSESWDPAQGGLGQLFELELFGRVWLVNIKARPAFWADLALVPPDIIFGTGILTDALGSLLLYVYLLGRQRSLQVRTQNARLVTVVENSSDAMVGASLAGVVTSWNKSAERIFGISAGDAVGRALDGLIVPVERKGEEMALRARIQAGEVVKPFDTVRRFWDGGLVDVSISASAITDAEGLVVGVGQIISDITARKRAERQLHEFNAALEREVGERTAQVESARRDLQTILDALPSMVGYWDKNLKNRFANHAYHDWFGAQSGDLAGKSMQELLGEDLFARNWPYIDRALRGESLVFERDIPRPDGKGVRHSLTYYLPDIVDGVVRGFYALVYDVTELTQNRQKLAAVIRENQALITTIKAHAIYSVTDRQGVILDVNEKFCEISGYRREELVGKHHRIINSGVHSSMFWGGVWQRLTSAHAWRGEICNRNKSGDLYWVDGILAPFIDDNGGVEKYISISNDVTASKKATRELAQERERLDNILRGTHAGTWEWNVQTGETRFNARWAEIIGYTLEELAPVSIQTWAGHAHPEDLERSNDLLQKHFSGGVDAYECECRMRHKNGHWVWVLDRGRVTTWTASGQPEWMHGIHLDITTRREAEVALLRLAAAEAASAAKSQFLATMSHEIRTPMNAVIGLSYLLEQTTLEPGQRQTLARIQTASRSLLDILNDVLDLSKIEAGEMALEEVAFDLSSLLQEIQLVLAPQAEAKKLLFLWPVLGNLPTQLIGDPTRIRQILTNLLGNAIKFTPQGQVALQLQCEEQTPERLVLKFTVQDSGIGISPEVQTRLFTPFMQADTTTTRRFGGTGLGLSIVHQLTRLMDGSVGVQSQVGQGSSFWVRLPLKVSPKQDYAPPPEPEPRRLYGTHILIVDDSQVNLEIAQRILEQAGAQVTSCVNGEQALEKLSTNLKIDLVLMDVQMPIMDGNEATYRIRHQLKLPDLPVLALTAGAMVAERQRSLEAGMNEVLSKPLEPRSLIRAICRHLHSSSTPSPTLPPTPETSRWPTIPGVDIGFASRQVGDDWTLFASMLRLFIEEYHDLTTPPAPSVLSKPRIHKMRGSAGALGLTQVHRLATELEGESADMEAALSSLAQALTQLALAAAPHLHIPPPTPRATRLTENELGELLDLLSHQDFQALACFRRLSGALYAQTGAERFAQLTRAIEQLDFAAALNLLKEDAV